MNAARVAQRLGQCATHIKMLEATSADHPERAARALALRNRISTSLEIGNFIHIPCPYGHWGMNLEDRRERLGLSPTYNGVRSAREARLQDDLRDGAEGMRKQLWNFRIGEEVEQLDKLDWFTVMVTLTVDPSIADGRRLIEDGKAWSAFLQRCAEVSRQACGVPQRQRGGPPLADYFRHVGVAEHGASRDHHHVHGLLHFKSLPSSWIWDENDGVLDPRVQQLPGVCALWDYGVQTRATAFRFAGDIWSRRYGFVWPLKDDGSALDKLPARASGSYFGKYMGKEHKEWHHRMKASRGYGMRRLQAVADQWSLTTSLALLERPGSNLERNTADKCSVPLSMVRQLARLSLISKAGMTSSGRRLLRRTLWTAPRSDAYSAMVKSVEDGHDPWSMDGEARFDWLLDVLPPEGSVSFRRRRLRVWLKLAKMFPAAEVLPQVSLAGLRMDPA